MPARAPRRPLGRWVAAVVAAVACTVAVVPPARAAVIDAVDGLLRFAGVEIRSEPGPRSLPTTPSPLPSIRSAALDEARRVARFPVRVPAALGVPDEVTVADPGPDGSPRVVTMSFRGGAVRFDQFDGRLPIAFMKSAHAAEWTEVGDEPALWIRGPHPISYVDRAGVEHVATARLAGPTLIWQRGGVAYRLEGIATVAEAVAVASRLV